MSKQSQKKKGNKDTARQSLVAKGMIVAGTGRSQSFKDKREKRTKDYKHSWQKEWKSES